MLGRLREGPGDDNSRRIGDSVVPLVWTACFAMLYREVTGTSSLLLIASYNFTTAEPILIAFLFAMWSLAKCDPPLRDVRSILLIGFCILLGINFFRGLLINSHAALFALRGQLPLAAFLIVSLFIPNNESIVKRILFALNTALLLLSALVVLRSIFGFSLFLTVQIVDGLEIYSDGRPLTSMGAFFVAAGCVLSLSGMLKSEASRKRWEFCALLAVYSIVLVLSGQRTAMIAGLCGMAVVFALEAGKTRPMRLLALGYAAFVACIVLSMDRADLESLTPNYISKLAQRGEGTHAWRKEVWDGLMLDYSSRWSLLDQAIGLPAGTDAKIYLPGMPKEARYWTNIMHSMYFGCLPMVGIIGAVLYVLFLLTNLCTALWKSFSDSAAGALSPAAAAGLTVLAAVFGYSYELLNEAGLVLTIAGLIGRTSSSFGSKSGRFFKQTGAESTRPGGSSNNAPLAAASAIAVALLSSSQASAAEIRRPLQDLISAIERSALKSASADELVVELEPVVYETTTPWLIDSAFSAIPENRPIKFKGVPGQTWLVGSKIYQSRQVRPDESLPLGLKNDDQLSVIDVDDDIKRAWRPQPNRTSFKPGISELEIFQGGRRLEPARWPDSGYARSEILQSADPNRGAFAVPAEKAAEWADSKGLKVGGYFSQDWFYETTNVEGVDPSAHSIRIAPLQSGYKLRPGLRYFVFNSAADLDSDGEYLIDREGGRIFVRGYGDNRQQQQYEVAIAAKAMIVRARKAITFEGVSFGRTRSDAVQVDYSEDIEISDCRVEGTGGSGIIIHGGRRTLIDQCVIRDIGESGVVLSGGNRQTLTPGDHVLRRSAITDTSVRTRTYTAAVSLDGVGNAVEACYIGNLPHIAISFSGNDHRIETNEITRAVSETSDAGAIYSGRDLTWRGNIIRGNYFHDILPLPEKAMLQDYGPSMMDLNGVYLDDLLSGTLVKQNIFLRVRNPVYIGGGRDNVIEENIFFEPQKAAIGLDDRGLQNWDKWSDISNPASEIRNKLRAVPTSSPLFAARYPELVHILDEEPGAPRGNIFASNIVLSGSLTRFSGDAERYAISRQNIEISQSAAGLHGLENIRKFLKADTSPTIANNTRLGLLEQIDKLETMRVEIDALQQRLH